MQPAELLSLVVEITVAIAGFSGIVVVLGRRHSGEWGPVDRIRFRFLLYTSFAPLGVSGLALILLASQVQEDAIWVTCSSVYALVLAVLIAGGVRAGLDTAAADRVQLALYSFVGATVTLLQVANVVSVRAFWPLSLALAFHIFLALSSFAGLILGVLSNEDEAR